MSGGLRRFYIAITPAISVRRGDVKSPLSMSSNLPGLAGVVFKADALRLDSARLRRLNWHPGASRLQVCGNAQLVSSCLISRRYRSPEIETAQTCPSNHANHHGL